MGYMHIENLYRCQDVLMFREVYALEKIHGTSAHVSWKDNKIHFFAGGCKHETFVVLFDNTLSSKFVELGHESVTVFGEQYGGKQQGMAHRYGPQARFVAFDVKIGDTWLAVPQAEDVVKKLGLEFVYYARIPATVHALDVERDSPSIQAKRNGVEGDQSREGIVIRPIVEMTKNDGSRIMAKHKRAEERETRIQREVTPEKLQLLTSAEDIAFEWVTPTRLQHVIDALTAAGNTVASMEHTPTLIKGMIEDVLREGAGEIVDNKESRAAIGKATARLFKGKLQSVLKDAIGG